MRVLLFSECRRAQWRGGWFSRLENKGVLHSCPIVHFRIAFATFVLAPGTDVILDLLLVRVTLLCDLFAFDDSVVEERYSILEKLKPYKFKNVQCKKVIMKKDAATMAMLTRLLDMEKNGATIET